MFAVAGHARMPGQIEPVVAAMRTRRTRIDLLGALIVVGAPIVFAIAPLSAPPALALDVPAVEQRAATGDAEALFQLADAYERGDPVEQDLEVAAQLLQAAAQRGHAGAQYRLGLMQAAGIGIDPDPVQGLAWATLAADAEGATGLLASSLREVLKQDLDQDQIARAEDLVAQYRPLTGPFDLLAAVAGEAPSTDGGALELPETDCGRLQVAEATPGPLLVTGAIADNSATASLVNETLAARLGQPFDLELIEVEPVLCTVLETLTNGAAPIDTNLTIALRDAQGTTKTTFKDQEHLVVELAQDDETRHLYLDYFSHSGEVLHLIPASDYPDNLVPAGAGLVVGEPQEGKPVWQIGPPFGNDLLVALVARRPLYEGRRPDVEDIDSYLTFLRDTIANLSPDHAARMTYRLVETVAR